jgi:hypothetical protein
MTISITAACAPSTRPASLGWILLPGALALLAFAPLATGAAPTWGGTPVVQPVLPPDSLGTNQNAFNNLAWQQFIALNWVADPNAPGQPDPTVPPSAFGTQLDQRPVVWESYKESSEVFRPGGAPPAPWKADRTLPTAMIRLGGGKKLATTSKFGVKGLFALSKFAGGPPLDLHEFGEASTGGSWLTAQAKMNNYITLFEKRLNEDEFNYINDNKLYDAANQAAFAQANGIILPDGTSGFAMYGSVGAIEIKAGWIELDDQSLWPLFKISQAYVSYPTSGGPPTPPKLVTVGLVALHIIHKTANAQQFVWSTFEHVNNAPSTTDISGSNLLPWYTYFNAQCNSGTDPYKCVPNYQPVPGTDPYNAPVQVVRTTPISNTTTNNIAALNTATWATIKAANPQSVFLNYQLVNVLWPNNNTPIAPGMTTPLPAGNPQPVQPVANTVLETYHQTLTCLTCHVSAPIAQTGTAERAVVKISRSALTAEPPPPGKASALAAPSAPFASDYSFLFGEATTPPAAAKNP